MHATLRMSLTVLVLSLPFAAQADPMSVEYLFSGHLTSSRSLGGSYDHKVGDPFSGTITYNAGSDPRSQPAWTFAFAKQELSGRFQQIYTTWGDDSLSLHDNQAGNFSYLHLVLKFDPGILSKGEFPTVLSPGDLVEGRVSSVILQGEIDQIRVVDHLQVVPEPSTVILLGTAAGLLGVWRLRRRR